VQSSRKSSVQSKAESKKDHFIPMVTDAEILTVPKDDH